MAFSFPPPSQLEPLLPDMEDDDEAEGKEGRGNVGMATGEMEWWCMTCEKEHQQL